MKKFVTILLVLLTLASCFALTSCDSTKSHSKKGDTAGWNSTCPSSADGSHGWLNYKCIYCGAVLSNSGSMSFWDKVGQGAMMVGTMIAVTALASLAYWLGCMFGWGWLTWVGHGLMVLMTIGMFITQHWIWGVVFLVLFGGAYIGLICPLITQRYYDYDRTIY